MSSRACQLRRWSRAEYYNMAAKRIIPPNARLQLISGNIIEMSPKKSSHATAVTLAEDVLRSILTKKYFIRVQLPLALNSDSEPEPDIAVVLGKPRDYRDKHPETAALIVKISDATLVLDRKLKKKLYVSAKISEYWILNLKNCSPEVYRHPVKKKYEFDDVLYAEDKISPIFCSQASVIVADMLP
jgi:Uma2 family endonuclease